jgi:hypothetical protein
MRKISYGIRWQPWIIEAVKVFAKRNSMDFSAAMNFLIENELNSYGYFRKDCQPGIVDEKIKVELEPEEATDIPAKGNMTG